MSHSRIQEDRQDRQNKLTQVLSVLLVLLMIWLVVLPARAQSNPDCNRLACRQLYFNDGNGNLQYICEAPQRVAIPTIFRRSDSTLTNIVVSSNVATATTSTAHKYYVGAFFTVSGAIVDPDLNATGQILSVPSSTTFTFATTNVADGTYSDATLSIISYEPRTSASLWHISVLNYNGTVFIGKYHAASSLAFGLVCDNRANY